MDNIEQFVMQPAGQGFLIKCRITRDRKGMDRGLYPTYYMHLERDDGRKVREVISLLISIIHYKKDLYLYAMIYNECMNNGKNKY